MNVNKVANAPSRWQSGRRTFCDRHEVGD